MSTAEYTTHSIYRITCTANNKIYIGQCSSYKLRIIAHRCELKTNKHKNKHLQSAYNKYGKDTFIFDLVEAGILSSDINEREIFWIAYYDSFRNGFNQTLGGGGQMGMGLPCIWNGIEYPTVRDAGRANNVELGTMWYRIKQGHKCDGDVPAHEKKCMWNGIEYPTIRAAAKALGITFGGMCLRIQKGYSCDADVVITKRICTWNGIQYVSINEAARANGLVAGTLRSWLERGYLCSADVNKK